MLQENFLIVTGIKNQNLWGKLVPSVSRLCTSIHFTAVTLLKLSTFVLPQSLHWFCQNKEPVTSRQKDIPDNKEILEKYKMKFG